MASHWNVEHFRATTFVPDVPADQDFPTAEWWSSVVGGAPHEHFQRADGSIEHHSVVEGRRVTLAVTQGRVDWLHRAPRPSSETPETFGSLEQALPRFHEDITKWLTVCPPVHRVAFGAGLVWLVDDPKKGFRNLEKLLPGLDLTSTNISDFMYRINRPRTSEVNEAITINRLATWSLSVIRNVKLTSGSVSQSPRILDHGLKYVVHLDVDVNTAGHSGELSELTGDTRRSVFSELAGLGAELANRGDVA